MRLFCLCAVLGFRLVVNKTSAWSNCKKGLLPLEVFSDSAAGALPAIWAKLPQSWIPQGKEKGWKKITKKCKLFLNGKEQKKRVNAGVKSKEGEDSRNRS